MSMPAGWYPDPFSSSGYVRWWDGQRWGASTSVDHDVVAAAAPGQPLALPPPSAAPAPVLMGPTTALDPSVALASYGQRALALILDLVLEGIVLVPAILVIVWPSITRLVDSLPADGTPSQDAITRYQSDILAMSWQLTVVSVIVTFLYQVPQNAIWGRTVGKRVVGIRIRPFAADGRLTWLQATIRWGTYTAGTLLTNGLFAILDLAWPLWDRPWRQALHDKTARTIVVAARPTRTLPPPQMPPPPYSP